ncbi:MAG: MotA/TolQ/ExbB proton channel family protein [Alphaproteobacteria bacterium]
MPDLPLVDLIGRWLTLGGPVVAILGAMSIVALAILLLKLYQFWTLGVSLPPEIGRAAALVQAGRGREALPLARSAGGIGVEITALALDMRTADGEAARETAFRLAADHLAALRSHFRTLELIGALAPLLGLFGTVLGMIEAFKQLEAAGAQVNPSVLSGGIWEALLTTAVGLAVAIPTVAVLNLLEQRVDRFAHELESLISRLFVTFTSSYGDAPSSELEGAADPHARFRPASGAGV